MTSHYWWTTPTSLLDRYKSLSQKQMHKKNKKNNQHKRNYLLTSKQQNTVSKVPIPHGEQQKKMAKRIWNWYFIYQFHRRPFMSLNWYPIWFSKIRIRWKLRAASTDVLITRWALTNTDKETKNGDSHAIRRQMIRIWRDSRHIICLTRQNKVSKWH